jgi:hypothetical protein
MSRMRLEAVALTRPSIADRVQLHLYFSFSVQCSELVSYWLRKVFNLTYKFPIDLSIDHCYGLVR